MIFATQVMIFGQDKWVMRNLENAYPHVDRIYVVYPYVPFSEYNSKARELYQLNTFDLDLIRKSKYANKITVIKGEWPDETTQRNECLQLAKKDGVDYLMIHDADEFYFHDHFEKLKDIIKNDTYIDNTGTKRELYLVKGCVFWKSLKYTTMTDYIITNYDVPIGGKISGIYEAVINLHEDIRYINRRNTHANRYMVIEHTDVLMYHTAYVLSNEELLKKLKTWSHSVDFDVDKWYNEVWLKWTPEMKNLHPIFPYEFTHAEPYDGKLPEVIEDLRDYIP